MAKRGRKPGFVMTEKHRSKIANSQILNRLIAHMNGEVELSATQVSVGLGLLKKVMPDLQATELTGELTQNYVARMPEPVASMTDWKDKYATEAKQDQSVSADKPFSTH